jgi:hypothetical protein
LANVPVVEKRIAELFERVAATALVSSAACGADLVGLRVAGTRGLRRRVILPFDRDKFRATSVTDRPGDWGPAYDTVLAELDAVGDVVTLQGHGEGTDAYIAANNAILEEATRLARQSKTMLTAVVVWDAPRGRDDITAAFAEEARRRGPHVEELKTL